jgi:hypothetical protein
LTPLAQSRGGNYVDDVLIAYALTKLLDDTRVGQWAIAEIGKRLKRTGPQNFEYLAMYTTVINELIDAARQKNARAA